MSGNEGRRFTGSCLSQTHHVFVIHDQRNGLIEWCGIAYPRLATLLASQVSKPKSAKHCTGTEIVLQLDPINIFGWRNKRPDYARRRPNDQAR